jgi:hypothetical protein
MSLVSCTFCSIYSIYGVLKDLPRFSLLHHTLEAIKALVGENIVHLIFTSFLSMLLLLDVQYLKTYYFKYFGVGFLFVYFRQEDKSGSRYSILTARESPILPFLI